MTQVKAKEKTPEEQALHRVERRIRKAMQQRVRDNVGLSGLMAEVQDADPYVEDGYVVQATYLGGISFFPSGKFYTPWANSNVERCPKCKGSGCWNCVNVGSVEAAEDEIFREELESALEELGLFHHSDGTDHFAGWSTDIDEFLNFIIDTVEDNDIEDLVEEINMSSSIPWANVERIKEAYELAKEGDAYQITEDYNRFAKFVMDGIHKEQEE